MLAPGDRYPLGTSVAGITILAAQPDDEVEAAIAANAAVLAERYPAFARARILDLVSEARTLGYGINRGLLFPGSWGMGVALHDEHGRPERVCQSRRLRAGFSPTASERSHNCWVRRFAGSRSSEGNGPLPGRASTPAWSPQVSGAAGQTAARGALGRSRILTRNNGNVPRSRLNRDRHRRRAPALDSASVACLLDQNWTVFALDLSGEAIATARVALAAYGERVQFEAVDVTDKAAIESLVARVAREFPPLRGLATCAGVVQNKRFLDTTEADFRRLYEVNVVGTFTIARATAEAMSQTGGGSI